MMWIDKTGERYRSVADCIFDVFPQAGEVETIAPLEKDLPIRPQPAITNQGQAKSFGMLSRDPHRIEECVVNQQT